MKAIAIGALAVLILGAGLIAGCFDEVADPEVDYEVEEVHTNSTSPSPGPETARNGSHFLYVRVIVYNDNEKADLTIGPRTFSVDDNGDNEVKGKFLASGDTRRGIDTIRVDEKSQKSFWVIFEVPEDVQMEYIRYRGTLDEEIDKELPDY